MTTITRQRSSHTEKTPQEVFAETGVPPEGYYINKKGKLRKNSEKTPKEIYEETGIITEGYHVNSQGQFRKIVVRGPKSDREVFHKVARAYLTSAFGFDREDVWVAKSRRKRTPTLFVYHEEKEIALHDWNDVHRLSDSLRLATQATDS